MKRWTKKFGFAAVAGGLALSVSGCADNENMLVVMGVMKADPPECVYTPSASATVWLDGVVDIAFGGNYSAVLLVSNQLMSTGSKARLRAESSNVSINNAVVRLVANGTTQVRYNSVPATGFVPVGAGEESGYGAIPVQVMADVDLPGGTQYVIAEIKLQGRTTGGDDVESNVFRYQIYVLNSESPGGRGLVTYTETDTNGVGYCNPDTCASAGTSSSSSGACVLGQDMPVSCCQCMSSWSFCRESP